MEMNENEKMELNVLVLAALSHSFVKMFINRI